MRPACLNVSFACSFWISARLFCWGAACAACAAGCNHVARLGACTLTGGRTGICCCDGCGSWDGGTPQPLLVSEPSGAGAGAKPDHMPP